MMEYYDSEQKNTVPSPAQFCMVCLNINKECKLYPVNRYNLDLEYEKLTGISLQGKMPFEPHVCAECAQRLGNCSRFRDKCLRAYQLLIGMADNPDLRIDRKTNQLASDIDKKVFQPDHCDLYLIHVEDNCDTEKNYAKVKKEKNVFEDTDTVSDVKYEIEVFNTDISKVKVDTELRSTVNDADGFDYDIDIDYCDDTNHFTNCDIPASAVERKNVKKESKNIKQLINDDRRSKIKGNIVNQRRKIKPETQIKKNITKKVLTKDGIVKKNVGKKAVRRKNLKRAERKIDLNLFQEIELTQEQQVAEIMNRKNTHNYLNAPHKCNVCYKGFRHLEAYNSHMDRHTDKFGLFECDICRMRFKSIFGLRKHLPNHKFVYKCTKCQFESNHRTAVEHHTRWHDGKTYVCAHCGEQFTKCTSYMSHLRIKHPSDSVCAQCGLSFIGQRGLRMHVAKKHYLVDGTQNLNGPSCEPCKIRFASHEAYKKHLKTSPKHAPPELKPNNTMQKKVSRNTTIVLSTCELCGMEVRSAHQYTMHFKTQHPDQKPTQFLHPPEMCEICGKIFKAPVLLRQHMQMHTGKKLYKCDICGKDFMTKGALKYHIDRHSDNLACNVCHKPATNPANLARHMTTHLLVKPSYECEYCGKSLTSVRGRDQHVSHVHHHVPWPRKVNGKRLKVDTRRFSVNSD